MSQTAQPRPPPLPQPAARGWRFWTIFPPLCIATLFSALESTVTSTSLPEITSSLNAGSNYTWFVNGYLLTSTVFIPFYGQFAQVFGRRWPAMVAVAIFTLGSGISGGANSTAMLIAGRLVQGLGGAGIGTMTNLIISDLVSVRERGKYQGIIFGTFGIGIAIGPVIGGAIAQSGHWRWVFWLNLPLGGVTLVLQFIFLQVTFRRVFTFAQKIRQIDWIGNLMLIGAMVAILIALSWADTVYAWSDWHILVPFLLGFAGLAGFHAFEAWPRFCRVPTIPGRLFRNRTSAVTLINTFLSSMLTYWRSYFLPVYFQGVLLVSPQRSGVLLLPSVLIAAPAAILSGVALSHFGRYKPIHILGYALMTLGTGLYIDYDADSSLAKVVLYQMIAGFGGGILLTTFLPAVQGANPPKDLVPASATWAYLRAFGSIWGIAIPSAIFNSRVSYYVQSRVSDAAVRAQLEGGGAYSHVSAAYIKALPDGVRQEVVGAYTSAMRNVWEVCVAFCAVALLLTFLEEEIPMRTAAEQGDSALKERKKREAEGEGPGSRRDVA
ncbi:MFS general substrate transporter [Aspergillus japonicus CBS 114.51]|uniref:MFS general substrate transporter n=1 Tax=Aspergillus japonicus CBS 114.51 TaxID=1448312 RepID=A0A8T8X0T5_ASPJA|nr:MFS general substrate transporter [Aspergillus japonicus CBS 114.51]RAH81748.1 MFS general substrate transporter [Aspergillus japonicus CBS 114.51]